MPDCIHAVVDPMEPPAGNAALDHSMRQPDFEQLGYRHDAVLTAGKGGDRAVEAAPLRTTGLKCTYTVDFPPETEHAASLSGRGARIKTNV